MKSSLTNKYLSFIVRFEKGYSRFACERELETEQNCNILTPTLMAVSVVSFSFSRAAQPEAQGPSSVLDDGVLYCILSPTSLDPNSSGPQGPLRPGVAFPTTPCLQLQLQLLRGPREPLRPGVAFPTTSCLQLQLQLLRGPWEPLRPGVAFPTTSCLQLQLQLLREPREPFGLVLLSLPHLVYNFLRSLSWQSYIIVHTHSIAHSIFGMACLIVIKRK